MAVQQLSPSRTAPTRVFTQKAAESSKSKGWWGGLVGLFAQGFWKERFWGKKCSWLLTRSRGMWGPAIKPEHKIRSLLSIQTWKGVESPRLWCSVTRETGCSTNGDGHFHSWGGCWSTEWGHATGSHAGQWGFGDSSDPPIEKWSQSWPGGP